MMDPKDDALLHAAIDGELSPGDDVELDRLMKVSEEARERFEALQRLTRMIDGRGPGACTAGVRA